MKRIILWDLDGTLLNTIADLKNAVNFALRNNDLKERSLQEVTCFIGNGIRNLIIRSVGENNQAKVEAVFNDFKSYYKEHCTVETVVYDGIKELLLDLKEKGYKLAIVSNKANALSNKIIDSLLPNLFDVVYGELENVPRKPAADLVQLALKQTGCTSQEAIYIGDSEVDVKTALNANVDGVFVSYGYRSEKQLKEAGATCIVASVQELKEKLCHYQS